MTNHQFMRGMGLGMLAGAALGVAAATRERSVRKAADKTMKVVEDATRRVSDAMGM